MKAVFLTSVLSTLISNGGPTVPVSKPGNLPEKCPSIMSLSSQGLDYVVPMIPGRAWIGVKENSHYDTNDMWTMYLMTDSDSKNGRVAIQQLVKKISSFHLDAGPEWDNEIGVVTCFYVPDSGGGFAATFTPSLYS